MYDNYLLSEITNKINPTKSTYTELNQKIVKSSSQRETKKRSVEKCYIEYLDLCESQKHNFIFSQNIFTDTGVQDLLIRMLCVAIQVNYYDEYMKNKYEYISFIHDFIDIFNFDIKKEKSTPFDKNSLYRQLKEIDIKNSDQTYTGTFLELSVDCLNKDIIRTDPFILK